MADNYLERRMDDYRSGRLARQPRKPQSPRAPQPSATAGLEGSRVLVKVPSASASPRATALIKMLTAAGCKVAFTDTDANRGRALAYETGAQCHPIDHTDPERLAASLALITRRWGGIDITIEVS